MCDTDHMEAVSAVVASTAFEGRLSGGRLTAVQDLPLAFVNSVVRPFAARSDVGLHARRALAEIVTEVKARHGALVSNRPGGVVQLSFSCMRSWINETLGVRSP